MATTTALATMAIGVGMSAASAAQANSNARRTSRSAVRQAEANKALTDIEFAERKRKLADTFSQYTKSLNASAGIRGVGETSSTLALQRASLANALRDQSMLDAGQTSANAAIDAGAMNIHNQALSQMQSPFLAGISGGLSGLQAGLSMAGSMKDAGWIE